MIVALIIACEVGFWVLLAARPGRPLPAEDGAGPSVVLLLCEPLLELVLFVVTAIDLKNGAEPGWEHGLAALYIGFTVGLRPLHDQAGSTATPPTASGGGPPPPKPPRYGMARARHEGRLLAAHGAGGGRRLALLQARGLVRRRRGTRRRCGPSSGRRCGPPASTG